uniref:Uncharacterized protein n=1 Tax=Candidatus Methanogaster sp. ANME-2c ERB4 TaxID=2759911 RepID=A0A7G9YMH2_9EURY|nr:hypothetical protein GZ17F1_34 [uncultured archaeon GZfos17F1]QNO48595.1 hypothetical protein CJINKJJD_00028 [Methanosarcinales archaeon ANME-2c ERB4]QNO49206.1 hypothetical protein DHJJDJHP_00013 [Methanosarcinales archaeon ANME-2c ERB4]
MHANETRTEKILNRVSSPGGVRFREFMEELKRLLEVETSSVDQNELRGELVQRQADQMDQVNFDVILGNIGERLYVTVSNRGKNPS